MTTAMSDYEYYPIECKLSDQAYYTIYASGDVDFVVSKNGCHLVFKDMNALARYVSESEMDVFHIDQCEEYDFELLQSFTSNYQEPLKNPKEIMDCWNLLDDISEYNKSNWKSFIQLSSDSRELHEKLLFDSNIFGDDDVTPQQWSNSEVERLRRLFEVGLRLFIDNMSIQG